jgi:hypothetical protein
VDKEDRSESDLVHDDLWSLDLNTFTVCSLLSGSLRYSKHGLPSAAYFFLAVFDS